MKSDDSVDRWFVAVFTALIGLFCIPVLVFDILPSQDAPNHFAIVATLARDGDAGWSSMFASELGLHAYHGYYAIGQALARIVGAPWAARLLLVAYVAALPLATLYFCRASGRSQWAAIPVFLLVVGDLYLVGLLPFMACIPLVMACAAGACDVGRGAVTRGCLVLVTTSLLAAWLHPMGAACALGAAAISIGLAIRDRRRLVIAVLMLVPAALACAGAWSSSGASTTGGGTVPLGFKLSHLLRTPVYLADADTSLAWSLALVTGVFAWLALAIATRNTGVAPQAGPRRASWIPLAAGASFLLAFLVAPFQLGSAIWFDLRLAPIVLVFLAPIVGSRLGHTSVGRTALVVVAVLAGAHSIDLHRRFAAESAPMMHVIDAMPAGAVVLSLSNGDLSNEIVPLHARDGVIAYSSPFAHLVALHHLYKGGRSPLMTFHESLPWIPLRLQPGPFLDDVGIADAFDGLRLASTIDERLAHFDYILVIGQNQSLASSLKDRAERLFVRGRFGLYRIAKN